MLKFQLTHLYKVRHQYEHASKTFEHVSTHAPIQGATFITLLDPDDNPVSTHAPIQGATYAGQAGLVGSTVSTHAPIQGATLIMANVFNASNVSTHAPIQGATKHKVYTVRCPTGFNSRTYTRCDKKELVPRSYINSFNSRTYTRCDASICCFITGISLFQLTHLYKVRLYRLLYLYL